MHARVLTALLMLVSLVESPSRARVAGRDKFGLGSLEAFLSISPEAFNDSNAPPPSSPLSLPHIGPFGIAYRGPLSTVACSVPDLADSLFRLPGRSHPELSLSVSVSDRLLGHDVVRMGARKDSLSALGSQAGGAEQAEAGSRLTHSNLGNGGRVSVLCDSASCFCRM